MPDHIVYVWSKNRREEVRASLTEYQGRDLADIRVFAIGDDDQVIPTRKGISVRVEHLPELLAAVEALIAEAGVAA